LGNLKERAEERISTLGIWIVRVIIICNARLRLMHVGLERGGGGGKGGGKITKIKKGGL